MQQTTRAGWWEQVGPKRRRLEQDEDILEGVRRAETVEGTLAQRLTQYVERIDTDMVREADKEAPFPKWCTVRKVVGSRAHRCFSQVYRELLI